MRKSGTENRVSEFHRMEHRGVEYTVVQGIERDVWKWSALVSDVEVRGQAHSRSAAVMTAERAIDRALDLKKARLVPPQRPE
jgi:hypothetical protein